MKLHAKAGFGFQREPFLALVGDREDDGCFSAIELAFEESKKMRLRIGGFTGPDEIRLPPELAYVESGDILRVNPIAAEVRVLYRRHSRHNFLFFTERCNSRCLMCSQPPRDIDDGYLVDDILQMIPHMAKDTPELGITGGEPTLLHDRLIAVIQATRDYLPSTALHILSNGRLFSYLRYARQVAGVSHPNIMIGVPLYSASAEAHDYVVQAKGAYEQTVFGLLNLARVRVPIELRMVIHRETYAELPAFARFVARNIPFVHQVAFMGLELMGYARSNLGALWIDPVEYQNQLEEAVAVLDDAGVTVFIFNHQLCLLRPSLHRFAQRSISDWKNIYLPACEGCAAREECGGFFASSLLRHSPHISAFREYKTVSASDVARSGN